jgi:predicted transcriptional regulator
MASAQQFDFNETASILDEEDDETLAAIKRGIKSIEEGRYYTLEEVREKLRQWNSKSSLAKIR